MIEVFQADRALGSLSDRRQLGDYDLAVHLEETRELSKARTGQTHVERPKYQFPRNGTPGVQALIARGTRMNAG